MPEKITIVQIGGSIERALKGDYQIDVKAILTESWQQTLKSRLAINLGLLFSLLLGMVVSFVASSYLGGIETVLADPQAGMLLNVVVTVAIWPFMAGVEMMGVQHAVGMKTHAKMTFAFLTRASWVVLCALFTSVLISLGFQLFILPGIFLAVTLSLTVPLVIEKKMMPMKAIVLSIQALRFKFFPLLLLYTLLLSSLIVLLLPFILLLESSVAPLGIVIFLIGISFLAPLFYNVKGIIYREIFGISIATSDDSNIDHNSGEPKSKKIDSGSNDTFSA
ncbi:MAG: hypothetical protein HRT51_11880 [Colwellia sp.]|nr:hypothetical protein [Colwellia sp.]